MGAINFIATTIDLRRKGMSLMRLPLTVLDLVHDRHSRAAGVRGAAGGRHPAAARPQRRHQLLRPRRPGGQRPDPQPQGRFAAAVAAPVLVLRAPRGLHRDPARHGRHLATALDVLAQADLRLSRHGVRHHGHRLPGIPGVGTPHVHERHEPLFGVGVFRAHDDHRRALGHQDVQLDRHAVGRARSASPPPCCSRWGSFRCSSPAA